MKKIFMDFNAPDMLNFRITKEEVGIFRLKISERIIFYSEDIQVEAIVFYDKEKDSWFGKIDSEYMDVPTEIAEAREDGLLNGDILGKWAARNEIVREMIKYGISTEAIMKITKISEEDLKRFTLKHNKK